ncbi:hypothetical protein MPER_09022, partial [Moniliophthora perniciosa FA553]
METAVLLVTRQTLLWKMHAHRQGLQLNDVLCTPLRTDNHSREEVDKERRMERDEARELKEATKASEGSVIVYGYISEEQPDPIIVQNTPNDPDLIKGHFLKLSRSVLNRLGIHDNHFKVFTKSFRRFTGVIVDHLVNLKEDALTSSSKPVVVVKASSVARCDGLDDLVSPLPTQRSLAKAATYQRTPRSNQAI